MKQYINITIIHYIINKIKSYINRQLKDISGVHELPVTTSTKGFYIFNLTITMVGFAKKPIRAYALLVGVVIC
jgi:hypothetical protein